MDSFEQILQRMEAEYEEKSGGKVEDVSEVGLRLRVLAGELHRLGAVSYTHLGRRCSWTTRPGPPYCAAPLWAFCGSGTSSPWA